MSMWVMALEAIEHCRLPFWYLSPDQCPIDSWTRFLLAAPRL